jgi:hypothetical protein
MTPTKDICEVLCVLTTTKVSHFPKHHTNEKSKPTPTPEAMDPRKMIKKSPTAKKKEATETGLDRNPAIDLYNTMATASLSTLSPNTLEYKSMSTPNSLSNESTDTGSVADIKAPHIFSRLVNNLQISYQTFQKTKTHSSYSPL